MKLPEQEKAAQKAAFRAMSPAKKLDHLYTYYKWPILLVLAALIVLGSVLSRELTRKEPVLYLALVNVSVGPDTEEALTDGFLSAIQADARRREVYLYRDLYLSDDADVLNHEYAYASRMKLMGAVQAQKLDLVLMNREGYDLLSRQGYLTDPCQTILWRSCWARPTKRSGSPVPFPTRCPSARCRCSGTPGSTESFISASLPTAPARRRPPGFWNTFCRKGPALFRILQGKERLPPHSLCRLCGGSFLLCPSRQAGIFMLMLSKSALQP